MTEPQVPKRSRVKPEASPLTSDLASRLARAQGERKATDDQASPAATQNLSAISRGVRLGSEFIAAILVGWGIGYGLDLVLGTRPWLMLVMLMVGFAAGVLNVVRSAAQMNRAEPPPATARGPDDEDAD
jgi:ATP synthase protein I